MKIILRDLLSNKLKVNKKKKKQRKHNIFFSIKNVEKSVRHRSTQFFLMIRYENKFYFA